MHYERPVRESGEKYTLRVEGLDYDILLPYVWLPADGGEVRIASLDLVGQTRLNQDMGRLLAAKLRPLLAGGKKVAILAAVEKALQLAQVTAQELGLDEIAVAHNRVKPHMEPGKRPVIQVGADSITSGDKFLALYERSLSIVTEAVDGIILFDDVISTGSTMLAMQALVEQAARFARLEQAPPILAMACAAVEGTPALRPLVYLTSLPTPVKREAS
ncbi:phosphoribosyltransferase family protein [Fundidesulfovibrio soli]|uniref:phosphoribosyltransferase family protein n=1 Tax=Fundidesulfovibrio soli TaxID=2922716 RepID=UPI001FB00C14|nr:phosphoribosyltransferase family protein [Fundidesulfovibrio soli]